MYGTRIPSNLFCSHAQEDSVLCEELEQHLVQLQRQGLILLWRRRYLLPGSDVGVEARRQLDEADVVVLLLSAHYLASDECYRELLLSLERHAAGLAVVIPICLRPIDLAQCPLGGLDVIPVRERPISGWQDRDAAWALVAAHIRQAIVGRLTPGNPYEYRAPLRLDSPVYVLRDCDVSLAASLHSHRFIAVWGESTVGKTSLRLRVPSLLSAEAWGGWRFPSKEILLMRTDRVDLFTEGFFRWMKRELGEPLEDWEELGAALRHKPAVLLIDEFGGLHENVAGDFLPRLCTLVEQSGDRLRVVVFLHEPMEAFFARNHLPRRKYLEPWLGLRVAPFGPAHASALIGYLPGSAVEVARAQLADIMELSAGNPRRLQRLCHHLFAAASSGPSVLRRLISAPESYEP